MKRIFIRLILLFVFGLYSQASLAFDFALASSFKPGQHHLSDYYQSEKLDGVRAYWDGYKLQSRGGKIFAAPAWFLKQLPPVPMDGELWGGRASFDEISGIVRRHNAHEGWRKVRFMVFELPQAHGDFSDRYRQMKVLEKTYAQPSWAVVKQHQAPQALATLWAELKALDKLGGEGFMLKRKQAAYHHGRSDDLLKVKLRNDAEATVLAYHQGKGRLANMMGSMTVEMPNGTQFKIGSGFSDIQRQSPPPIGTVISYKYHGLTKSGKPRFPVFWRLRTDEF